MQLDLCETLFADLVMFVCKHTSGVRWSIIPCTLGFWVGSFLSSSLLTRLMFSGWYWILELRPIVLNNCQTLNSCLTFQVESSFQSCVVFLYVLQPFNLFLLRLLMQHFSLSGALSGFALIYPPWISSLLFERSVNRHSIMMRYTPTSLMSHIVATQVHMVVRRHLVLTWMRNNRELV